MWTYLGQNFLTDSKVRSYIADKVWDLYKKLDCNSLIEIWPGKWAITKLINQISDNFIVIEKDENLVYNLESKVNNWELTIKNIIWWDVLDVDIVNVLKWKKLKSEKTLVIGNLPYYITSPILRKFFADGDQSFPWWIFMLQNEVWEKIRFDAKKKSYLWRLLNYWYDVIYLKMVPAKAFSPAPKVKSCLVKLEIKNSKCEVEWNNLLSFLDLYSGFSRKTLWAIEKILIKHWSKSDSGWKKTRPESHIKIPAELEKKRLEELNRDDLEKFI